MSSNVMFRYQLAPTHAAPVAAVKIDDLDLEVVARRKRKQEEERPWPLRLAAFAFLWGTAGFLGYGVYQRFVGGLL